MCKMCSAATYSKFPADDVPMSIAVTSKPRLSKLPLLKKPPTPASVHPCSIILDIVGIAWEDCGTSFNEHECCGMEVICEDIIVWICKEQILVQDNLMGKERMKEKFILLLSILVPCTLDVP